MEKRPKIMVIDDEQKNLRLIDAFLTPAGYDVQQTDNGKEGIDTVKKYQPDVLLLDIMMPGMDGFEVCSILKQDRTTRDIPIVMVTALNDVTSRVKSLKVGADDFLSKPVEKNELLARVKSLVQVKYYHDYEKNYQKQLEEEVNKKTIDLNKALDKVKHASIETIYRLSRAAEYKDEDTGAHIQRMSHTAAVIARHLGLNEKDTEAILYAAPLHDIGKIGIPDRILLKSGKLNDKEWKVMQKHTLIGASILENSAEEFIEFGRISALTHHECWDGSGYPQGLKGEEIPLVGRITAIADVFDSLLSKRPYKDPFPLEQCNDIIAQGNGTHFDPEIVDLFFRIQPEILSIREKFSNDSISLFIELAGFENRQAGENPDKGVLKR